MNTAIPYWIRQMIGAEKRAKTFREKSKTSRDPAWCLAMARGAELDAVRCFRRWRLENPNAPHPVIEAARIGKTLAQYFSEIGGVS